MQSNDGEKSRALRARAFAALWAALIVAAVLGARPVAAAPFAYVTSKKYPNCVGTVSVIDTGAKPPAVMATVPVGSCPVGVAITPDGKHAYVANLLSDNVSVIDTASNLVVATVAVGSSPFFVAITPDGTHAYVTNNSSGSISVIDTASNTVVATITVGLGAYGVAVTPDGKHAYVTKGGVPGTVSVIDTATNTVVGTPITVAAYPYGVAIAPDGKHAYVAQTDNHRGFSTISVIDTASNTVVGTIALPVGSSPDGIAVTPDGQHAYVANAGDNNVSVIDTASNTVVATVAVGALPEGVAVTPDGTHAYVVNLNDNTVSVIATASNTVVATVAVGPVGSLPVGVGIIPPPPGVPFSAFSAKFGIQFGPTLNYDRFQLQSSFTLGSASNGINPVTEPVTLKIGAFAATIPPGSFKGTGFGPFTFHGMINGVALEVRIKPTGAKRYAFHTEARHANLTKTVNPAPVTLTIGDDSGATSVTAAIK